MTSVSYTTLLSKWFRVHIPLSQKSTIKSISRTGYAAAYPEIKQYHRRQINQFSCLPLFNKSKKKNQIKISKKNSSIKGCASFARYDIYQEGNMEEDC